MEMFRWQEISTRDSVVDEAAKGLARLAYVVRLNYRAQVLPTAQYSGPQALL